MQTRGKASSAFGSRIHFAGIHHTICVGVGMEKKAFPDINSPVKLLLVFVPLHRVELLLANVVAARERDHVAYIDNRLHDDARDVEGFCVGQNCVRHKKRNLSSSLNEELKCHPESLCKRSLPTLLIFTTKSINFNYFNHDDEINGT